MAPLVLVLDQGGHSSRALVFDAAGTVVAQAREAVATHYLSVEQIEQNPHEIVQSLRDVVAAVSVQLGECCGEIVAAALIVQRSSVVALDEISGMPLSPILSWQDTRNANWLAEIGRDAQSGLRQLTGLRVNAHYGASKMRWLLDNMQVLQQAVEENTLCITPLAGFLCRHLTDASQTVVDAVIASRTLLTAISALHWPSILLDFFTIPENILPSICATLADYGEITVGDVKVPLRLLGGDQSFFMLSHGKRFDDSAIFINAGTGAFVQQAMPAVDVPSSLLAAPLVIAKSAQDSVIVAEGTVNAAATALDWWWQQSGVVFSDEDWCAADAESAQSTAQVPVFINRVTALGSPDWLPAGESYFTQNAAPISLKTIAVLEAIVFALQRNIDLLATVKPCQVIVISGGLSKLDVFCQRIADLSGKTVTRSDDAEACARGAAAQLLPNLVAQQNYQIFSPAERMGLHQRYQQWTALMNQLSADVG